MMEHGQNRAGTEIVTEFLVIIVIVIGNDLSGRTSPKLCKCWHQEILKAIGTHNF